MVRLLIVVLYVPILAIAFVGAFIIQIGFAWRFAVAAALREHHDMAISWRTNMLLKDDDR